MASPTPGSNGNLGAELAAHAASGFLLGLLGVVSRGLDLIDTLLLLATLQANITLVTADRELQLRYSALDALPPDDLRRPISVTALAGSISLPFETVRRRLAGLEKAGLCEVSQRGYRVPARVLLEPRFASGPHEIDLLLRQLHQRLVAAGCLDDAVTSQEAFPASPVRISSRLASDYFLRLLTLVTERAGDPIDGFLLVCIYKHNADAALAPGAEGTVEPWPSDDRLAPVKAAAIARQLDLPHETVRRRLLDLSGRGLCARTRGGWVLPGASRDLLRFDEAASENLTNLRQLFAGLARLGVVDHWRRDAV